MESRVKMSSQRILRDKISSIDFALFFLFSEGSSYLKKRGLGLFYNDNNMKVNLLLMLFNFGVQERLLLIVFNIDTNECKKTWFSVILTVTFLVLTLHWRYLPLYKGVTY